MLAGAAKCDILSAMDDIRILALDLDGTLLDSEKRLSEVNRNALAAAAAKGLLVVPTTGRFFGMMPPAVRDLPFVRYAITVNGAQVYDRETDTAIVREELPLGQALAIMRYLDGFDVIYDCYQDNWGRMTQAMQEKAEEYAQCPHYVKMIREFRKPYPDLKEYLRGRNCNVQKIMLFARDPAVRDRILADIQTHFDNLAVSTSTFSNLEINTATAHKGRAIERFAAHFGWTLANCMAFGDGLNDLSMVKMAGTGVAMANAAPEVLAAADYVTLSNDDDGVAAALRHFLSL